MSVRWVVSSHLSTEIVLTLHYLSGHWISDCDHRTHRLSVLSSYFRNDQPGHDILEATLGLCKRQRRPVQPLPFSGSLQHDGRWNASADSSHRSARKTEYHTMVSRTPPWRGHADASITAVLVTLGSTVIFSLIILGSSVAFNIILSITNVELVGSYITCIGIVLVRRLKGKPLPPGRFDLGRAGPWINGAALCWLLVLETFVSAGAQILGLRHPV